MSDYSAKIKLATDLMKAMDDHEMGSNQAMKEGPSVAIMETKTMTPEEEAAKHLQELGNPNMPSEGQKSQFRELDKEENPKPSPSPMDKPKEQAMIEGSPEEEAMETPSEEDKEDRMGGAFGSMLRSRRG